MVTDNLSESLEMLRDDSLHIFLEGLKELDSSFCNLMVDGSDFTLRLEIRGNAGKLLHCRSYNDTIRRPAEAGDNRK